jgi:hypothetical protein
MFFRFLRGELSGEHREAPVFTGLGEQYSRGDAVAFLDKTLQDLR